ncbi:MAG: hypothetical protein H8F28_12720, partial [Fibrella sp.]|nr:hypothetical protein [Armatimonadota bacterium]
DADRCLAINQKTIALFGTERDSFYYPAAVQEMRGQYAAALENYRRALECDRDSEHAQAGIERMEAMV